MMVHISQKVVSEIRSDLFRHTQRLPLTYFDAHTHGELMSRFTNDVDTISEALNNSFAMMIQSFITITGTMTMLLVLRLASFPHCHGFSASHGSCSSVITEGGAGSILSSSRNTWEASTALWRKWWPDRRWKRFLTMRIRILRSFAAATKRSGQRPPGP